jgi:hypothetical protein
MKKLLPAYLVQNEYKVLQRMPSNTISLKIRKWAVIYPLRLAMGAVASAVFHLRLILSPKELATASCHIEGETTYSPG